MNILTFEDAENYLKYKQVYFKIEICNSDFKTEMQANYVYTLENVTCSPVRENTFYLAIQCNGVTIPIYKDCESRLAFFAWIRTNFIPLSELIHVYNQK